jgi:hypothetical protein
MRYEIKGKNAGCFLYKYIFVQRRKGNWGQVQKHDFLDYKYKRDGCFAMQWDEIRIWIVGVHCE